MNIKVRRRDTIEKQIDKDVYVVGELFRELFNKFNRVESKKHLYKGIKELTLIEINTILVVGIEEMKSMSAIAKELGVTFGTPTVTIDRLIEKGFVNRVRDKEDRRQVFIKLSKNGEEVFHSIMEIKTRVTQEIFGILTQKERSSLVEILSKLNNNFDELIASVSAT